MGLFPLICVSVFSPVSHSLDYIAIYILSLGKLVFKIVFWMFIELFLDVIFIQLMTLGESLCVDSLLVVLSTVSLIFIHTCCFPYLQIPHLQIQRTDCAMPFYIRDLSICGFWSDRGMSWNQPSEVA